MRKKTKGNVVALLLVLVLAVSSLAACGKFYSGGKGREAGDGKSDRKSAGGRRRRDRTGGAGEERFRASTDRGEKGAFGLA